MCLQKYYFIFGKCRVNSNTHLKHCELRGIDNLSIAAAK